MRMSVDTSFFLPSPEQLILWVEVRDLEKSVKIMQQTRKKTSKMFC